MASDAGVSTDVELDDHPNGATGQLTDAEPWPYRRCRCGERCMVRRWVNAYGKVEAVRLECAAFHVRWFDGHGLPPDPPTPDAIAIAEWQDQHDDELQRWKMASHRLTPRAAVRLAQLVAAPGGGAPAPINREFTKVEHELMTYGLCRSVYEHGQRYLKVEASGKLRVRGSKILLDVKSAVEAALAAW